MKIAEERVFLDLKFLKSIFGLLHQRLDSLAMGD